MTQTDRVLEHLKRGNELSQLDTVLWSPRILRLAPIISILKKQGHNIQPVSIPGTRAVKYRYITPGTLL